MSVEYYSLSPDNTRHLGEIMGNLAGAGDVFLLTGKLGAGKTCLTQGIARGLGIREYAVSPTFILMREMKGGRLPLYHIDFYRLDNLQELADLGLDDYFYGNGLCVVEWAEKAMELLPREYLDVKIFYTSETERRLVLEANGERYNELLNRLGDLLEKETR